MTNHKSHFAAVWIRYTPNPSDTSRWWVQRVEWVDLGVAIMDSEEAEARVQGYNSDLKWVTMKCPNGKPAMKEWGNPSQDLNSVAGIYIKGGEVEGGSAYYWIWGSSGYINAGSKKQVWKDGAWRPGTSVYIRQELHHEFGNDAWDGHMVGRVAVPR